MSIPDTFRHVKEALGQVGPDIPNLDVTPDFLQALEAEGEEVAVEINGLEDALPVLKRKLDNVWNGQNEFEYELVSVFMHRGKTSGAGHYWTYQSHLPDDGESICPSVSHQILQSSNHHICQLTMIRPLKQHPVCEVSELII